MQDLYNAYTKTMKELRTANKIILSRGIEKAKTEKDYRIARAKLALKLKAEGNPITLINDLVRGDDKVADYKMAWDIAESSYESNMEYIRMCKIEINSINSMMEAERKGV